MAEMNKKPVERINFATAKSLFEKDNAKTIPKSPSWTGPSSTSPSIQRNEENGGKGDSRVQDPLHAPHGGLENRLELGRTTGMSLSASFDSSTEAPKTNFVIPKKRGDTSDLRWLTAVHNSRPLGTCSSSEKVKADADRGHQMNRAHVANGTELASSSYGDTHFSGGFIPKSSSSGSLPDTSGGGKALKDVSSNNTGVSAASMHDASKDYPDSCITKLRSSSVKAATIEVPKSASNTTAATVPKPPPTPSGNWKSEKAAPNGKADHNLEKVEKTPIVKSSMTVTLNTGGVGGAQVKGVESANRTVPGFSAVLEEIQSRKLMSITAESRTKVAGSSITTPPPQGLHPLQAPVLPATLPPQQHLQPKQDQHLPAVSPPQQVPHPPKMSEKTAGAQNTEEDVHRRVKLMDWNPTKLMRELYKITLQTELEVAGDYINMEGYLEKLPISKAKDTFLKTWKRRYFKAHNGTLHYYESVGEKKESGNFKLNGGRIEEIGERMLGIEDGRGHYLVLRCASEKDYMDWKRALQSQTVEGIQSTWIKPSLRTLKSNAKKVIILELGSCAIRAGILGENVALPDVFLPTVVATHRETGQRWFCFDAFLPEARACSTISYPVRPTAKVDKYSIDWDAVPGLFDHVFHELKVDPSQYSIMFSTPTNFSDKIKSQFMDLFVNHFKVGAINMVCQTILSLYSYDATSGVVVDIGDRIEILPVADGYVVEGGVMRMPYGGQMITDALNRSFTDRRYRFFTDVEFQIVRLAMEKLCYVSSNFDSEKEKFHQNPEKFSACLPLDTYDLPTGNFEDISIDLGRFQSPEGLFDTFFWGLDNPPIHEMIQKAIQTCPIDMRRQMWRSVYLSGGVTLVKGFAERLQAELSKLSPSAVVVQVHAAPNRYHSSYIGASALALMQAFDDACISASEWRQNGTSLLKKWKAY